MIDAFRFINSRDVADYLRSISHEFTASQAAYLVHKCDSATLAERIGAWRAIVAEMPDERLLVKEREFTYNVHELVEEHIAKKESEPEKFLNADGAAYFPYESRWSDKPRWVSDSWFVENGCWNTLAMPVPFSTFDKCKDYLRREEDILENGWRLDTLHEDIAEHIGQGKPIEDFHGKPVKELHYDRHVICRVEMDEGWYCSYGHINDPEPQSTPLDYVVLDGDLEVMDVAWSWKDVTFDYIVPAISIPFKRGDIALTFGQFLDDFAHARDKFALISEEPAWSPEEAGRWYYDLAATAHKLANDNGLPVPGWCIEECYFPAEPQWAFDTEDHKFREYLRENTPREFRWHNLFLGPTVLQRA